MSGITLFELAGLPRNDRIIEADVPVAAWLSGRADDVRSVAITAAIAATATLGDHCSADPAHRASTVAQAAQRGAQTVPDTAPYDVN